MSEEARIARGALADSPHSLYWMNELGRVYANEAQWDKSEIVLLRGWKRAGEITDPEVRFRFLIKLCEVSYHLQKYRQAFAVLKDIEEPQSGEQLSGFLLLACRVHARSGSYDAAVKSFFRAIRGENLESAMKALALAMHDLQYVGAYEHAKDAVEAIAGPGDATTKEMMIRMLDDAATPRRRPDEISWTRQGFMYLYGCGVAILVVFIGLLLYNLEQWSLSARAEPRRKNR